MLPSYSSVLAGEVAVPQDESPRGPRPMTHEEVSESLRRPVRMRRHRRHPVRAEGVILDELFAVYTRHREHWSQLGLMTDDAFGSFVGMACDMCSVDRAKGGSSTEHVGGESDSCDEN